MTLTPGVYCFSTSAGLTGTLTLDFQGNANAQSVFQIGSTLTTASSGHPSSHQSRRRTLPAERIWQVGSSATLGTGSTFVGNILALTSITLTTGVNVNGRDAGRNGAVTLDTNAVTACADAVAPGRAGFPTLSDGLLLLSARRWRAGDDDDAATKLRLRIHPRPLEPPPPPSAPVRRARRA